MEQILSLFKLLTPEQKKELKTKYRRSTNTGEKLIHLLLSDETSEAELLKKLGINAAALGKTQAQSAEILTDYIKQHTQTPFDEIYVIDLLVKAGDIQPALHLFYTLEKEYETKQQWVLLDNLYSCAYSISRLLTDNELTENIANNRSSYAAKHAMYTKLHGQVMIELSNKDNNTTPPKSRLAKLQKVNKQAYETGHHELIHHSLLLLLHQYTNYYNEPGKAYDLVKLVSENRKKHLQAFSPAHEAEARLANVNFLCVHDGYGSPEAQIAEAYKRADAAGTEVKAELLSTLLAYYLCEGKVDKTHYYLKEMEKVLDKKSFAPFKSMVMAITSFIENNYTGFKLNIDMFYNDHATVNSPALEAMMRIMELLILKHDKEDKAIKAKLTALKLFVEQNLNKERHSETYDLLEFIGNPSPKNRSKAETLKQSQYCSSRMLGRYVFKEFK